MVSETKIWSVITVVALSTLLGLLSMELGVFSDSDDDNARGAPAPRVAGRRGALHPGKMNGRRLHTLVKRDDST